MRPLSAAELLDAWEEGYARAPVRRALLLLAAASPTTPPERLAELSIGQRDARLLRLREWIFGPQLDCLLACPQCGEQLELALHVADVWVPSPSPAPADNGGGLKAAAEKGGEAGVLSLCLDGYEVQFRLPNSLDLIALRELPADDSPRLRLLERCLLTAHQTTGDGQELPADELPNDVVGALVERMANADPQADVQLAVECPACGHGWAATFDIVSFFWSELNAWAQRTLYQVHTLAQAYGWREADVLAMSPWRRQYYLEMVRG
jgi:hypothetical protein